MRKIYLVATLLTIILTVYIQTQVFAEPANKLPIEYKQPDGTVVTIKLKGDENFSWAETLNGYTLLSNGKSGWEYAVHNADGDLVPSGILAHNASGQTAAETSLLQQLAKKLWYSPKQIENIKSAVETRLKSASSTMLFSPIGTKKLLMLLVQFSDRGLTYGQAEFNGLMNTSGYNANGAQGSVRDYFLENSYGAFDITTDVYGPYSMPKTHDYYGGDVPSKDYYWKEMVEEAVRQADVAGVDFKDYDSDLDGVVDGVYLIFAGWSQAHSGVVNDLWSKAGTINYTATNAASAGTKVTSASISNEILYESVGHTGLATIGVICHEFGHVCNAPDYYDTNYETGGEYSGTGDWDIMCGGNNNGTTSVLSGNTPAHFNPYTKMMFGWLTPVELTASSAGSYSLSDITTHTQVYKVNTKTPGEYFLLENRQQTGFNTAVPGHGLMIYHKDTRPYMRGQAGNNNTHPLSLYPKCANSTVAIPTADPYSYGDVNAASCPFPGSLGKRSFQDADIPSAQSWADVNTGLPITNITENADHTVSFNFLSCINVTSLVDFGKLPPNTTSAEQSFTVSGSNLPSGIVITPPVGFEISLTSGTGFVGNPSSLTIEQSGGTVTTTTVYVRFHPTAYQTYSGNINLVSGAITQIVPVIGQGNGVYWTGTTNTEWNLASNWASGSVPTSVSDVIIPTSGVTNWPLISTAAAACQDITLQSGAQLTMSVATAYTLSVSGNWTNNGTFTKGIGTVDFNGTNALQTIIGSSTTDFYILKVSKGSLNNTLEAVSQITLNATTPEARLQLVSGTFKLSNSSSNIIAINSNGTAPANALGDGKRIWVNAGTLSVNSSWRLNAGELKITGGVVNVGNANNHYLDYLNNGKLNVQGGQLNVSAGIFGNAATSIGNIDISGGTVTVGAYFNGFERSSFEVAAVAKFTMSGGTIAIRRSGTINALSDYKNLSATATVTGGTLQIGNASTPASQTIRINSTVPIYNLVVNSTNAPTAQLVTNELTVKNDVTISGGTLNADILNLNVGGNWTNNGSFTPGTATVTFNGTVPQTLSGATTFNNLTFSDVGLKTISSNASVTVNGALNQASGSSLTIASTGASATGSLIVNGSKNIAGTVNVQRYLPTENWHLISSPVSGQTLDGFAVANAIQLDAPTNTYDIGPYDEANDLWDYAVGSSNFTAAKGYSTERTLNAGAGVATFSGNGIYSGTQTVTLVRSGNGWNCIGNPFTSAIKGAGSVANTFLGTYYTVLDPNYAALYFWNNSTGNYDAISNSATTEYVSVGQGFFVKPASAGISVAFNTNVQVHQNGAIFKDAEIPWPTITLKAETSDFRCNTVVNFNEAMTTGLDPSYDAGMFKGNANIALYTKLVAGPSPVDFSVQSLPPTETNLYRISVGLDLPAGGQITFTAETLNLMSGSKVILEDCQTKTLTDLGVEGAGYTTVVAANTSGTGRFYLYTGQNSITSVQNLPKQDFNVFIYKQIIYINGETDANTTFNLYNMEGKQFVKLRASKLNQNTIDAAGLPSGVYLLHINKQGRHQLAKLVLMN